MVAAAEVAPVAVAAADVGQAAVAPVAEVGPNEAAANASALLVAGLSNAMQSGVKRLVRAFIGVNYRCPDLVNHSKRLSWW